MKNAIGFMQGRLSPLVGGRIQAFPAHHWHQEFPTATSLGLTLMEWTLDAEGLYKNPLMSEDGRLKIVDLARCHRISIPSVTGDFIMHAPFYKSTGEAREKRLEDLANVIEACGALGISLLVFPLVDDGSVTTADEERNLVEGLAALKGLQQRTGVRIVFESDLPPRELGHFIRGFSVEYFGINLDLGNSASLGFDVREEIDAFGERIQNVHVKDRLRGGTTVPLGEGSANLPHAIRALTAIDYRGNYILQTARAPDGDHAGALSRYHDMLAHWLQDAAADVGC